MKLTGKRAMQARKHVVHSLIVADRLKSSVEGCFRGSFDELV